MSPPRTKMSNNDIEVNRRLPKKIALFSDYFHTVCWREVKKEPSLIKYAMLDGFGHLVIRGRSRLSGIKILFESFTKGIPNG